MADKINRSDEDWRKELSKEEFDVCRLKGTEAAFTGEYTNTKTEGTYLCRCCEEELFSSDTKFDSGSGWPSFYKPLEDDNIDEITDVSHGMQRVEVTCYSTMGLTVDGTLVTQSEYYEELGKLPQSLNAEILDISLSTYGDHALILDEHGEVHFMGMDWTEVVHLPAETQSQIVAVAAGADHALALSSSGEVFAWGSEGMGAIDIPVDLPLDIIAIDASGDASAALSAEGILTIWGQPFTIMTVPQSIQGRIKAMRISPEHILVVLDDGALLDLGNVRGHSEQPLFFGPQTGP